MPGSGTAFDFNGDGTGRRAAHAGVGGGPSLLAETMVGDPGARSGVPVRARDTNADGATDLAASVG